MQGIIAYLLLGSAGFRKYSYTLNIVQVKKRLLLKGLLFCVCAILYGNKAWFLIHIHNSKTSQKENYSSTNYINTQSHTAQTEGNKFGFLWMRS